MHTDCHACQPLEGGVRCDSLRGRIQQGSEATQLGLTPSEHCIVRGTAVTPPSAPPAPFPSLLLCAVQAKGMDVSMSVHDDRGLLALQGPSAQAVLQKLTSTDLSKLYFGMFARFDIKGAACWVTRTG